MNLYIQQSHPAIHCTAPKWSPDGTQLAIHMYDPQKEFRSVWIFHVSSVLRITKQEKVLPQVFSSFLQCYWLNLDLSKANQNKIKPEEVRLLHIDYDKYSAEKDPAHGLFSGYFGKEWSDQYMKEFLFPLSVEDSNSLF